MLTMDFFGSQDRAKRWTQILVGMFIVMTCVIVVVISMAASLLFPIGQTVANSQLNDSNQQQTYSRSSSDRLQSPSVQMSLFHWEVWAVTAPITLLIILGGTAYSLYQLRAGGPAVAQMMGGREITHHDEGLVEKRLLNVVEEMSLASGCPPPRVYVMDHERAINAFAAGYSLDSSVVAVTRGTLMMLDRDELQGVVAHEFSHILNGDMRLNLRMLGLINGLSIISNIGYYLMMILWASGSSSRRSNKDNGGGILIAIMLFGLVLFVIGWIGVLCGSILKAAVSRQREFLADAAAVQFTRNPGGISGALKKIGGFSAGGRLGAKHSASFSHMMFACGVSSWMNGMMSTHPRLATRIQAIEPGWDGFYTTVEFPENGQPLHQEDPKPSSQQRMKEMLSGQGATEAISGPMAGPMAPVTGAMQDTPLYELGSVMESTPGVGAVAALAVAQHIMNQIPDAVMAAAHVPSAAQAIIFALIYDTKDPVARGRQNQLVEDFRNEEVFEHFGRLKDTVVGLPRELRLPVMEICLNALKRMSKDEYHRFENCLSALVQADDKVDMFEWMLHKSIQCHLEPHFVHQDKDQYARKLPIKQCSGAISVLLSTLARIGAKNEEAISQAFEAGVGHLNGIQVQLLDRPSCRLTHLDKALDELRQMRLKDMKQVLAACVAVMEADGKIKSAEAELYRAVADAIGVPVPPMYAGAIQQ